MIEPVTVINLSSNMFECFMYFMCFLLHTVMDLSVVGNSFVRTPVVKTVPLVYPNDSQFKLTLDSVRSLIY